MKDIDFDMSAFGLRLRQARKSKGFSQEALSRRLGVKQPWISELEHGGQGDLQVKTLLLLSQELSVSVDYLLGLSDAGPASRPARARRRALGA